jgi:hypothetical protein
MDCGASGLIRIEGAGREDPVYIHIATVPSASCLGVIVYHENRDKT